MVVFWLLAAAMVVVALAFVLPPLLGIGRRDDKQDLRVETNVALYRERLAGMEAEHAAGDLDDAGLEEARRELQRELLHDAGDASPAPSKPRHRSAPMVAVVVAAALPLLGFGLYLYLGKPAALDPAALAARETPDAADQIPDQAAIEQMVSELAARLEKEPDDGEGWKMLARSYFVLQRYAAAAEAYSRAHDLLGEQPDMLVDWAEALAMAGGESLLGRPRELIDRALELQPGNARGLWLGGFAELQADNRALAIERWQRLRTMLPPNAEASTALDNMLAQLSTESTAAAGSDNATASAPQSSPAASGASIVVEVSVAPELAARLKGDESLYVFARASKGPRIPLAVVRARASELPFTTTLDESQAMQPGMTIASVPEVIIGARITSSGQPTASSGDLQGFSGTLAPGSVDRVRVVIDEVVP